MRRPSREINIFSLSALDLFASAMGAFIIIAVILFPYYLKTHTKEDLKDGETELARLKSKVKSDEITIKLLEEEAAKNAEGKEVKPFIAVTISWENGTKNAYGNDVDLHIIDKQLGHEYSFKNKKKLLPGSLAMFEEDTEVGPGNEFWSNRAAQAGEYEVYYVLFKKGFKVPGVTTIKDPGAAIIRGSIIHPYGRISIPKKVIVKSDKNKKYFMGTIIVSDEGGISFQP